MALSRRLAGYLGAGARAAVAAVASAGESVIAIARRLRARFGNLGITESRQLARYIQETQPPPPPSAPLPMIPSIAGVAGRQAPEMTTNYRYIVLSTFTDPITGYPTEYSTALDSTESLSEEEVRSRVEGFVTGLIEHGDSPPYIPAGELPDDFDVAVTSFYYREQ